MHQTKIANKLKSNLLSLSERRRSPIFSVSACLDCMSCSVFILHGCVAISSWGRKTVEKVQVVEGGLVGKCCVSKDS